MNIHKTTLRETCGDKAEANGFTMEPNDAVHVALTAEERRIILDALSYLPLAQSYTLFNRILEIDRAAQSQDTTPQAAESTGAANESNE